MKASLGNSLVVGASLFAAIVAACASDEPARATGVGDALFDAGSDAALVDGSSDTDTWDPPVTCGASMPGPDMKGEIVEARPGYASELEALDPSTVPDPFPIVTKSALARATANFMLLRASGTTASKREAELADGLGRAVLGAVGKGSDGELDVEFLRRGLAYFYPCSRPFPSSLTELASRYGDYTRWSTTTIACSKPKNGPRRLYENHELGMYVAETLDGDAVRETEVLFRNLRTDGQFDFAVYTAEGALTDRSTFATTTGGIVTTSAPYTCMTCHFDANARTFTVRLPHDKGAGCK